MVWLSEPENPDDLKYQGHEIYAEILKEKEEARKKSENEREERIKKAAEIPTGIGQNQTMIKSGAIK
jgi:hypothetical protein